MADTRVVREDVEVLADILDEKRLTEIEYENGGVRIRVARGAPSVAPVAPVAPAAPTGIAPEAVPAGQADAGDSSPANRFQEIKSPMVGTFYLAPSPEAQPFVELGGRVAKGEVVCIIEAMKLMNEIESDCDGVVAERLVENGQGVEYDQPLFRIAAD